MLIKYLGLFLIFICSVLTGFSLTNQLNNRVKVLKSIKSLLQQFKIEITYNIPTMAELFSEKGDKNIFQLTEKISKNLKSNLTPEESVAEAFDGSPCTSILSDDEKCFLIHTFSSLGKSDTDGQVSLIENSIEQIDFYIENAVENERKNSKVYMTASIYAGLALIIILL